MIGETVEAVLTDDAVSKLTDAVQAEHLTATGNRDSVEIELIEELKKQGVKFTEKDIVFITKDVTGEVFWLETGNSGAGLEHLLKGNGEKPGHAKDLLKAFGVTEEEVPGYLKKVMTEGIFIDSKTRKLPNGRLGFERRYDYNGNHYILVGVGNNGFIVTAYPVPK